MGKSKRNKNTYSDEARSHYRSLGPSLHRRDPFLETLLSPSPRPPRRSTWSDPVIQSDGRLWRPEHDFQTLTWSGTPARSTRLYDAPRAPTTTRVSTSRSANVAVQAQARRARAQINRFGPDLDRQTRAIVAFDHPQAVPECCRREVRREVLMAHGRGGSRVAKPRFSERSKTGCR